MAVPVNTSPPTITAQRVVGQTITGINGTWDGSPTFARQWQRAEVVYHGGDIVYSGAEIVTLDWEDISGQAALTHVLTAASHRHILRLKVTGTNGDGSAVAYSAESAVAFIAGGGGFSAIGNSLSSAMSVQDEEEQ